MFRFPWLGARRGAPFCYPSGEPPQTVVLRAGFEQNSRVRWITPDAVPPSCEVLAGTIDDLRQVSALTEVARGVVVFTYESALSDHDRDWLWMRFGAPVFEQYLSADNQLLATECDAHDGLHVIASFTPPEGFVLDTRICGCGDRRPRLAPCEMTVAASA